MSNHLHLVVQSSDSNLSDILRDFKSYLLKYYLMLFKNYRKAEENGCLKYLRKKENKIAITQATSFGSRITSSKRYTVKTLLFRSLITYIIIL